ncbi:MAG: hypothetical protein ACP5UH_00295 [Candidatus Micrarchaeia archaeon]
MYAKDLGSREKFIIIAIAAISLLAIILWYLLIGAGWDLIAHMLNAKSMMDLHLYHCMANPNCGIINGKRSFYYSTYFEPQRAPMVSIMLMPLYLIFGDWSTLAYALLVFSCYLAAIYYIAKNFGISRIAAYAAMASPYFVLFLFVNGAELLSLVFVIIALAFLSRKSAYSGLFLGLAFVSKYTTMLLLPMLLLLIKPKKIALAVILALVPSLPWIAFQLIFMHGALASYLMSIQLAADNFTYSGLSVKYLMVVISYPLLILAAALILLRKHVLKVSRNLSLNLKKMLHSLKTKTETNTRVHIWAIAAMFVALSIIEYAILINSAPFAQARLGYLLAFSLSLFVALAFTYALRNRKDARKIEVGFGFAFIIFLVLCYAFFVINANADKVYSVRNVNITDSVAKLYELGYGGCRVVSNDWIYLLYYGVNAFPQYYPNSTNMQYPIIVFYNASALTSNASIQGINSSSVVYSSKSFSIMLPKGYKCYK